MINNGTKYTMVDIMEYLAGYTTKLKNKIIVLHESGRYYDTVVINEA